MVQVVDDQNKRAVAGRAAQDSCERPGQDGSAGLGIDVDGQP